MSPEQIAKYLVDDVRLFWQAPITSAIVILALAAFFWWLANWRFGDRLANKDAIIATKDAQIAHYKDLGTPIHRGRLRGRGMGRALLQRERL